LEIDECQNEANDPNWNGWWVREWSERPKLKWLARWLHLF
jgi:hypothetical protein